MLMQRIILAVLVINTLVAAGSAAFSFQLFQRVSAQGGAAIISPSTATGETAGAAIAKGGKPEEYKFFPVQKVIVSLQDDGHEHYFVLDLVLQAEQDTDSKKLEQVDPMVRNSVVSYLSGLNFGALRAMPIPELQTALEKTVLADFANRGVAKPFAHVLVSKLVVQ